MEKNPQQDIQLPPGFRFHPSDEELIVHYLRNKATKSPLPASIVTEVELYKYNPWDLPKKSMFGEEEWYFFTPRERKYPNGMRPNRMADSGYWKATGIDKPILTSCGSKVIGVKKALVFYTGRPPKGNKTDWIMHEYRLPELEVPWQTKREKSMRLDDWVLCRVRQKSNIPGNIWELERNGLSKEPVQSQYPKSDKEWSSQTTPKFHYHPKLDKQCSTQTQTTPKYEMVRDYLYKDCPMLPFLFGYQNFPNSMDAISSASFEGNKTPSSVCEDNFNIEYLQNPIASSHGVSNMRKRKPFEGNSQENFWNPNKKAIAKVPQKEEIPPSASSNNINNGIIPYGTSPTQVEKSNYDVDQLSPIMMYQELYSLAFG